MSKVRMRVDQNAEHLRYVFAKATAKKMATKSTKKCNRSESILWLHFV